MDNPTPRYSSPTDFRIFLSDEGNWILRDHRTGYDYPFVDEQTAVLGLLMRIEDDHQFHGRPSPENHYGRPAPFQPEASS